MWHLRPHIPPQPVCVVEKNGEPSSTHRESHECATIDKNGWPQWPLNHKTGYYTPTSGHAYGCWLIDLVGHALSSIGPAAKLLTLSATVPTRIGKWWRGELLRTLQRRRHIGLMSKVLVLLGQLPSVICASGQRRWHSAPGPFGDQ